MDRILMVAAVVCFSAAALAGSSRITGRVFERGSMVPIPFAALTCGEGCTTSADAEGSFTLDVPPGSVRLIVSAPGHEPLQLVETIAAGVSRTVEYRLMPLSDRGDRYRSTVRGDTAHEGASITLRDDEMRRLPGTLGDPLRVIGSLPGVVQPVPLLPVYVVRGGSPGMNGFFIDGMRVPQLFHLVLVDGVVHPRVLDRIEFHAGTYDVAYGHVAGGVVDAATRPARSDAPAHGEVELRPYDASVLAELRLPAGVSVLAAGRYGMPGLVIGLFQPGLGVTYGDYQLRLDWKGLTVEALGSYDAVDLDFGQLGVGYTVAHVGTTFHRVQVRERVHRGSFDIDAAVVGGFDRMTVASGQSVEKLGLSARVQSRIKLPFALLQLGIDGELSRFRGQGFTLESAGVRQPMGGLLNGPFGMQPYSPPMLTAGADDLGELAGNHAGLVAGAYAQAVIPLDRLTGRPTALVAGVRADVYHSGSVTLIGVDPRLLLRYHPIDFLELHAGFGLYQQPPSFPVPLPGIDTFGLKLGLQRAWQGSAGMNVKLPYDLTLAATGYYARFRNINDVVLSIVSAGCTAPAPEHLTGAEALILNQLDGAGYGMELMLRRLRGTVTGWISYTLSRSERVYSCGLAPSDFDQTHVITAVVQARLPWRLMAGLRLTYQTGRPFSKIRVDLTTLSASPDRNNARLPGYFELDLRLDREWRFQRWSLSVFVELLNATWSQLTFGVSYPDDPKLKIPRYDKPQFQSTPWILPSLGLRGSF